MEDWGDFEEVENEGLENVRAKGREEVEEEREIWKPRKKDWEMVEVGDAIVIMTMKEFEDYLASDAVEAEVRRKVALEKEYRSWPCSEFCSCIECEPEDYVKRNSQFVPGANLRLFTDFPSYRLRPDFYATWQHFDSMEEFWAYQGEEEEDEEDDEDEEEEEMAALREKAKKWKDAIACDFL